MTKQEHPLDIALNHSINGQCDLAEEILKSQDQNDPRVIFNLGWHQMRHGQIADGLRKMDAGRFINCFGSPRIVGEIWNGQPLENKTLIFRCEGGLGDEIINFRFAKYFKDLGARVVINCNESLAIIFSRHGYVTVGNEALKYICYDYWVPAMSALHIAGYDKDTLSGKPYLTAEPKQLYAKPGTLKVGIRWAGNPKFEHEQHRKFNPQPLIDLHELPGITLYSLQRDEDCIDGLPFADLRNQIETWEDTASTIMGLDLVITSCTSVAHMSAALGKETWVIVPVLPYYIWAIPGNKSVWYDSVTLFRQQQYGDWSHPLNAIRQQLIERTKLKEVA